MTILALSIAPVYNALISLVRKYRIFISPYLVQEFRRRSYKNPLQLRLMSLRKLMRALIITSKLGNSVRRENLLPHLEVKTAQVGI